MKLRVVVIHEGQPVIGIISELIDPKMLAYLNNVVAFIIKALKHFPENPTQK